MYNGNRARYTVSTASLSLIGCWPESMRPALSLSLSVPFKFLRSVPLLPSPPPQTLCTRSYTYLHVPSRGFVSSTLARNAWNAAYRLKLICFCCGTAGDSDGRRWPGRVERGDRLAVGESGVRLFFDDIGFD